MSEGLHTLIYYATDTKTQINIVANKYCQQIKFIFFIFVLKNNKTNLFKPIVFNKY